MENATVHASNSKRSLLDIKTASEIESQFRAFVSERLFDQPEAIEAACRLFRRVVDPFRKTSVKRKPIYVLVNAGESRTGKTYLAELIAEFFHGNPEALLFINGSDYMEHHQLINLVGAPRSYVGYVDPKDPKYVAPAADEKDPYAELSAHNLVWSRKGSSFPLTVILVDEWEKACKPFNRVFLRIMDKARATLGNGAEVDFSNCVIILTTNLGMAEVEEEKSRNPMGFNQTRSRVSHGDVESIVLRHMRDFAAPEFRNRVRENGEIVVFRTLTQEGKYKILDRDIVAVQSLFTSNPDVAFTLTVDGRARKLIMDEAMAADGNVSNLKAVVQKRLEEPLKNEVLKKTIGMGDLVEVTGEEGSEGLRFYRLKGGALLFGEPAESAAPEAATATEGGSPSGSGDSALPEPEGSDWTPGKVMLPPKSRYAIVPGVPVRGGGVLIDMSELMFLMRAADLRTQAKQYPRLMAHYVIRMTDEKNLDALTVACLEMVRDLHDILGVKVLHSETTYEAPFAVTLKVLALPGQIDMIAIRFPGVTVTLDEPKGSGDGSK